MRKVAGTSSLLISILRQPVVVCRLLIAKDRDGLKALFVSAAFQGRSVDDVTEVAIHFASDIAEYWMRSGRLHSGFVGTKSKGHVVVLVSASLQPYLDVPW
jgi:hypothetical protein